MSGMTLMEQINAMAADAEKTKKEAESKSKDLTTRTRNARRKSRDLEQDFFGTFIEEVKDVDAAFKKYDKDNSETIDQTELTAALKDVKGAQAPPDAVFKKMIEKHADSRPKDAPKDAPCTELSLKAWRGLVEEIKNKGWDETAADEVHEQLKRMFAAADTDDSKSISKKELELALKEGVKAATKMDEAKEITSEQWTQIVTYADVNKDAADEKQREFSFDAFCKLVEAIKIGRIK